MKTLQYLFMQKHSYNLLTCYSFVQNSPFFCSFEHSIGTNYDIKSYIALIAVMVCGEEVCDRRHARQGTPGPSRPLI